MASLSPAAAIECFHLAFLQVLGANGARRDYVVKGGANLRYFFNSHRYSEDIDFDSLAEEGWRLKERVDQVLASPALVRWLGPSGVELASINSEAKQTPTTRRWKLRLKVPGLDELVSTKIEFSQRNGDKRWEFEAVPSRIVSPYGLRPPTLLHYTAAPATEQKVLALALRNETQTRDVFDLELLFRTHPNAVAKGALDDETLAKAIERCLALPFDAFEAHVLPFLEPDVAASYRNPADWEQMKEFVAERLMELMEDSDENL
jgi:hypothetical protein